MVNVANTFSPPIFTWKIELDKTVPQWNIFSNATAKKQQELFYKKQENLAEQKRRLKKYIFHLKKLKTLEAIKEFKSTAQPFFDSTLNAKWEQTVNQHSRAISRTQAYRERRMEELGIKK